jgi:phage tail tube protein FII
MIEVNNVKKFELDKLNFVYKVNGVDLLAAIRKQV